MKLAGLEQKGGEERNTWNWEKEKMQLLLISGCPGGLASRPSLLHFLSWLRRRLITMLFTSSQGAFFASLKYCSLVPKIFMDYPCCPGTTENGYKEENILKNSLFIVSNYWEKWPKPVLSNLIEMCTRCWRSRGVVCKGRTLAHLGESE